MARPNGSRTGRCQGCNHAERVRIERLLPSRMKSLGLIRANTALFAVRFA
jgi:hypothetical protein